MTTYSLRTVADALGCSIPTVGRLIHGGWLKASKEPTGKSNARFSVEHEDLEAFLALRDQADAESLTTRQVAEVMGWKLRTVQRLIHDGHLTRYPFPGRTRVTRESLAEVAERLAREAAVTKPANGIGVAVEVEEFADFAPSTVLRPDEEEWPVVLEGEVIHADASA